MSEHTTQSAILEYLQLRGIFHYRNNTGAIKTDTRFFRYGALGSPDIICVFRGKYIGIEVKSAKGKLRESQDNFREALTKLGGGEYLVVRSIDDVANYFEPLLKGRP